MNKEEKEILFKKLCGKQANVRFDITGHGIEKGSLVYIKKYDSETDTFIIEYSDDKGRLNASRITLTELNFRNESLNLKSLVMKGRRIERPDDYGSDLVIKLEDDGKTIYLSAALRSLLLLSADDYVGFSVDTQTARVLIFKGRDESEGYAIGGNGKIKSSADWRELNSQYGNLILVRSEPFTDDENFAGYLFYNIVGSYKESKDVINKTKSYKEALLDVTKIQGQTIYEMPVRRSASMFIDSSNLTNDSEDINIWGY